MSGNSGTEGAVWRPRLNGYTVTWDDDDLTWVATRDDDPDVVLRGKNQEELHAAHARHIAQLANDLLQINNYAAQHGYTPPPRDWLPPRA